MKFFIASSLLLALGAYAQTATPSAPGATAPINQGITTVTQGLGSSTVAPNPQAFNPSVNPTPDLNPDGSIDNNPTVGPYYPSSNDPNLRQSQEAAPAALPGQPSAYPPVNNPGLPSNVDANGRPIAP